jgi:hypothetical protein
VADSDFYHTCAYPKGGRKPNERKKQLTDEKETMRTYLKEHPRCEHPGCKAKATEIDHVTAKGLGGTRQKELHGEENMRSLCQKHHALKHGVKVVESKPRWSKREEKAA